MATLPPLPPPAEEYLQALQVERGLARTTLGEYRRDLHDFCRWLAESLGKDRTAPALGDLAGADRERARAWLGHLHERELARALHIATIFVIDRKPWISIVRGEDQASNQDGAQCANSADDPFHWPHGYHP